MVIKNATQVGNPTIRARAKRVSNPTAAATRKLVKDLIDSMRHHGLVGMAAPQIGKSLRIFVTEPRNTQARTLKVKDKDGIRVFINPRITSTSRAKVDSWEGCGSVADKNLFGMIRRFASVTVEAYGEDGKKFTLKASGLLARVIQHEMDHLNGKVFTDAADPATYMSRVEYLKTKGRRRR